MPDKRYYAWRFNQPGLISIDDCAECMIGVLASSLGEARAEAKTLVRYRYDKWIAQQLCQLIMSNQPQIE